ncbi:hypothetical protein FRACYDRAFT_252553 [Fragilariopsis cylindrus CCMP1102]|uniref:Uncharacterized protein n=1 Tax=Fragilariopsis cylindrus CCMP1102 TaxID=635003 RepID=A0A1E7EMX2_9STRA|nr:hypothetical protein FRACYDRAFT_252553 [Fragilariopsis cylindrus CCMP1102]|eukprot:OEU06923.1 hypothetical protein FRACYDRAFT_252553 [Fragilariopsis cylindrus CCMP1102]
MQLYIHYLNNKACTLVTIGEYSEANQLFELAFIKHSQTIVDDSSSSVSYNPFTLQAEARNHNNNNWTTNSDWYGENYNYNSDSVSDDTIINSDNGDEDDDSLVTDDDSNKTSLNINSINNCYQDDIECDQETTTTPAAYLSTINNCYQGDNDRDQETTTTTPVASLPSCISSAVISSPPVFVVPLRRMTTSSQLRTLPYCGQFQHHQQNNRQQSSEYHQVYSLPIVMSEYEWDTSKHQEKYVVLMFNIALCNHLHGMDLLSLGMELQEQVQVPGQGQQYHQQLQQQQQQQQLSSSLMYMAQQSFHTARNYYRLALSENCNIDDGSINDNSVPIYVFDKFTYPAIFNNMSHVCKSLDGYGYNSSNGEAYGYDTLLLKSIYWLRVVVADDSSNSNSVSISTRSSSSSNEASNSSSMNSNSNSNSSDSASTTTPMMPMAVTADGLIDDHPQQQRNNTGSSSSSSSSYFYDDNDADIIDAFMENVFYLIGVSDNVVPASAA